MKTNKSVFFIVFILILAFAASTVFGVRNQYGDLTTTYIKGLKDIRLGIDIQGGVDVTFAPADEEIDASRAQLEAVEEVMKARLVSLGINDYEVYMDESNDKVIVRFPWQTGESNFDPQAAVKELGDTAKLQFRKGYNYTSSTDDEGNVTITPGGEVVLEGTDVEEAYVTMETDSNGNQTGGYAVALSLKESGKEAFRVATQGAVNQEADYLDISGSQSRYVISIWMDTNCISYPSVNSVISGGQATITGDFDYDAAKALADKINGGALPFNLVTEQFKTISPSMGNGALQIMMLSGAIALILIMIYMIAMYRLPGFVASIALIGQVAGTLAVTSGWFGFEDSNTLTIPGIAGIILAIGMGVDCNIITGERIKEELRLGKTIRASVDAGYKRAFTAILDSNITTMIAAVVLYLLGTGTIRGFAITLGLGVIVSMFTVLVVSRFLLKQLVGMNIKSLKAFGL